MRKSGYLLALLATALAACGGGDSGDDAFQPGTNANTPATTVASVTVVTDTPAIPSSGLTPANISVLVRDASNKFMKDVPVQLSTSAGAGGDGGGLAVTNSATDENGVVHATLSIANAPASKASRVITVTAVAGTMTGQTTVAVDGSTVDIQGPDSLITNTAGNYTVHVADSANNAVANATVALSTQPASTLSAASVTTDTNGVASFTMTPTSNASVTITATSLGETKTKTVSVSSDNFSFAATPAQGTEFALGIPGATLSVNWLSGSTPINSGTVTFSTTRGAITGTSQVTPVGGVATVNVRSAQAGEAVVTAVNSNGGSTQRTIVFVASAATAIDVQANPFSVGINQSSTLTATVRDASNNLVANKDVQFQLTDTTGGVLSLSTARTDSQGRARTVYTASSTTSATNGVRVTAKVIDTPAVTDYVDLTVAGAPVFLKFGTGNTIEQINNDSQYRLNYTVQVTDANGVGVAGATVTLSALSWDYVKGHRVAGTTSWGTTANAVCVNEDRRTGNPAYDFNGILDPGENENGTNLNGVPSMESGNVAAISPGTGTTDASGFLAFTVTYPQDHAEYASIVLRARTAVQGTEYSSQSLPFILQGAASDFNNIQNAPPGMVSPFGDASTCSTFN